MVAAHSCCEPTLCSFSCNRGELAMVNAVKKAIRMLMPIPARAFMPAGDLVDARHCASFSNPSGRLQENLILFLFLLLSLFRWEIAEGLRIGMADLGRAGCQPAVRGSLPRTDFEHTLGSRKEDIRRSNRMQQAGSLRSPDPRLRSRQWNNCNVVVGWTARRCCSTNRPDDWSGENLFHCFWNSDDCRRSPWLREGGKHGFNHRRIDFGRAAFAGSVVDAGTSSSGIDHCPHCFTAAGGAIYSEIFPHLQSDAGGVDVGPERYRDHCRDRGLAEEIIACGSWGLARCAGSFSSFFLRSLSQSRCVGSHWNAGAGR